MLKLYIILDTCEYFYMKSKIYFYKVIIIIKVIWFLSKHMFTIIFSIKNTVQVTITAITTVYLYGYIYK